MSTQPVQLTRQELYDRVWAEPMRTVAKRLGISDVGLAKNCRRLRIPVPGRGYWAKKAAGHQVERTPLGPLPPTPGLRETTLEFRPEEPVAPPATPPGPVADQLAFEALATNRIAVADSLRNPHPLVRHSLEVLKIGAKKDTDFVANWQEYPLDLNVSKALLPRAARIMDATIKAMEKRGWKVAVNRNGQDRKTFATVLGQRVPFGIRERIKKVENEPAKPVRSGSSWYTPYQTKYRDEPTGRLSLVIRSRWDGSTAIEKSWDETASEPLETRLNDFMVGVVEFADHWREWERQRQEGERLRQEAERRRLEEQRRQQLEAARGEALERQASRWAASQQIRAYLVAVRHVAQLQQANVDGSALAAWLEWADGYARAIDPLGQPVETLVQIPPPKPAY